MKFALVAGTRPELIKLKPVWDALKEKKEQVRLFWTSQHYTATLGLGIMADCRYDKRSVVIGTMDFENLTENWLEKFNPDCIVVQGDTTTAVLGALAGVHMGIKVAHVEAGLRSYDFRMREERNRCAIDQMSDMLFCPMEPSHSIRNDVHGRIFVVGNTIVDVIAAKPIRYLGKQPCVVTLHRPELVDDPPLFEAALLAMHAFLLRNKLTAMYPLHPRSQSKIDESIMKEVGETIKVCSPVMPHEMHEMIANAPYVFTDSGGVQEEACILKTKTFTIRPNTERPETIRLGTNVLIKPRIAWGTMTEEMETATENWVITVFDHPYGKDVGRKIADLLMEHV